MYSTIIILSCLLPIFTIAGFVIGYNVNASKKIMQIKRKNKPTEIQRELDYIENAWRSEE